jgi:hypothetical protein
MRRTALFTATLAGCTGPVDDTATPWGPVSMGSAQGVYVLELSLDPDPPVTGDTRLAVLLLAGDAAVEGAALTLTPWMPEHGHGVGAAPRVTELGDGAYEADFAWSMPGAWEVTIDIEADGGPDTAVVAVEVE